MLTIKSLSVLDAIEQNEYDWLVRVMKSSRRGDNFRYLCTITGPDFVVDSRAPMGFRGERYQGLGETGDEAVSEAYQLLLNALSKRIVS
jgi:hypothetical protein